MKNTWHQPIDLYFMETMLWYYGDLKTVRKNVSEKKVLDPSIYSNLHQKLMGYILGRDPSFI